MKKHLMRTPAIMIVSIALPCLVELLMEWMSSLRFDIDGAVVQIVIWFIFAIYAGTAAYFRGKKYGAKLRYLSLCSSFKTLSF
jgi:hypothetical protein